MRTFVLGLDGCSWRLLDPWIERGELPALKALRDEAAWGEMESCLPPVTSPNWKCYATGRNPGRLGVFWWENIDYRGRRLILPRSNSYDGLQLWDYLSRAGHTVAVINVPTTYPPKAVNGVLIAGGPDALDTGYTYPSPLEDELRRRFSYRVHPPNIGVIDEDPESAARQILPLLDLRFRVADYVLERYRPDFVHLTLYYINVLQHHLWDHPLVLEAWKVIDRNLAALRERLSDWLLLLMVDHGTNQIATQFNISTWMQREGYLRLRRPRGRHWLPRLGLSRERVARVAAALGIKDWLKAHLSVETRAALPSAEGTVGHAGRAGLIDWERSQAVPSGQGPVYLNPDLPASEQARLRRELRDRLLALRDDLGRPIAKSVFDKEEIYSGPHLPQAPDLIIEQADGVHITASIGSSLVFQRPARWEAENHRVGLFAAAGPAVARGALRKRISILDLAPTILHLYGLPVPREMDGRVLRKLFVPESDPYRRQVRYLGDGDGSGAAARDREEEETAIIEKRLRDLGYF